MEKRKEDWRKKVPKTTINNDLQKYKNDPFFKEKLDKVNQMIANGEMPSFVYEMQKSQKTTYTDTILSDNVLSVANEPPLKYGAPKEE